MVSKKTHSVAKKLNVLDVIHHSTGRGPWVLMLLVGSAVLWWALGLGEEIYRVTEAIWLLSMTSKIIC
jgi:hypothetical protein